MRLYLDSAYLAKCYLTDRDSTAVRALVSKTSTIVSSAICLVEVGCAIHRRYREGIIAREDAARLRFSFLEDVTQGTIKLVPVTDQLLRTSEVIVAGLPPDQFLRSGDAIHLASAQSEGFKEIWSNDRHLLAAARHFRLKGRSV